LTGGTEGSLGAPLRVLNGNQDLNVLALLGELASGAPLPVATVAARDLIQGNAGCAADPEATFTCNGPTDRAQSASTTQS